MQVAGCTMMPFHRALDEAERVVKRIGGLLRHLVVLDGGGGSGFLGDALGQYQHKVVGVGPLGDGRSGRAAGWERRSRRAALMRGRLSEHWWRMTILNRQAPRRVARLAPSSGHPPASLDQFHGHWRTTGKATRQRGQPLHATRVAATAPRVAPHGLGSAPCAGGCTFYVSVMFAFSCVRGGAWSWVRTHPGSDGRVAFARERAVREARRVGGQKAAGGRLITGVQGREGLAEQVGFGAEVGGGERGRGRGRGGDRGGGSGRECGRRRVQCGI